MATKQEAGVRKTTCLFLRPDDVACQRAMIESIKVTEAGSRFPSIASIVVFLIILAIGAWFRFHDIGIKPLHHDEGVNSYFLLNLARFGEYKYDPTNYHGPMLYYFALISMKLMGETELALRFWPALFGMLTILLLWPLRTHLGRIGTGVAAILIALSPGLVYFSRDFIHEMAFGCLTLGMVVGLLRYFESGAFRWILLFAVSTGLLLTAKETAVITVSVFLLAILSAYLVEKIRMLVTLNTVVESAGSADAMRFHRPTLDHLLSASILIVFIYIFLYSSTFKNWQGVIDFFRSIWHWASQRGNRDHVHPFYYYLGMLIKLELPLLLGSALGGLIILIRGTRFWLFTAAWTFGTLMAYSLIPYKTPWLMINFLIPMALLCGYAAEQIFRSLQHAAMKGIWAFILLGWITFSGVISHRLNFREYDDNRNPGGYFTQLGEKYKFKPYVDQQYGYVYAQTDRDLLELVKALKSEMEKLPTGSETGIYIASPDYWPLPWYLRSYGKVAFSGSLNVIPGQPISIQQPLMIANINQQPLIDGTPGWNLIQRSFTLRPGVELILFKREDQSSERKIQ